MRRNRKPAILFDKEHYLQRHVLDAHGDALVWIQLDDLQQVFSPFSPPKYEELDEALAAHIDSVVYPIPLRYQLILEFQTEGSSLEQQERVKQVIRDFYCLRCADKLQDLRINIIKIVALFTMGALLLTASYHLASNGQGQLITDFMNIAGTFALWETVGLFLLEQQDIQLDKKNAEQTARAIIRFPS